MLSYSHGDAQVAKEELFNISHHVQAPPAAAAAPFAQPDLPSSPARIDPADNGEREEREGGEVIEV